MLPAIATRLHTGARVIAVTRHGMDRTCSRHRDATPFLVRVEHSDGNVRDYEAAAVIDASGTWSTRNPLGTSGLPALGEAAAADRISSPLPDVLGRDRKAFAGHTAVVVGAGHSAANTLINLADLASAVPGTRIRWIIRGASAAKVYGGGDADELAARGQLGSRLSALVDNGTIELHTGFGVTAVTAETTVTLTAADGRTLNADIVVPATGFRPDVDILRELRLELDSAVEAPRRLGPLIDPEFHSCGTVEPHGAKMLAHPEQDFYIVGMKSYGRAPTFLLATGYEQVRSVAAALAGDEEAANAVELQLPETGVCCRGPEPVSVGFPTRA